HRWQQRPTPNGLCADMPRNSTLPVAQFASSIRYGEAGVVVSAAQQGHIARVGNLEVVRDAAGVLVVTEVQEATAADTVGQPYVRFVTAPFQQSEVLLPGGVRVRLNAGSTLSYPLLLPEPDVCYMEIAGEAQVVVPADAATARVVVATVNSQVQVVQGEFAVLATAAETRVTLLDGQFSIISKQRKEHKLVKRRGDEATVRWTHELNGTLTETLDYR